MSKSLNTALPPVGGYATKIKESESSFNVGDRVIRVNDDRAGYKGEIVEIGTLKNNQVGRFRVKWDAGVRTWCRPQILRLDKSGEMTPSSSEPAQGKVKKERKLTIPEQKIKNNYRTSSDKHGCPNCIFKIGDSCKNLIKPMPSERTSGDNQEYGAVYNSNTCDLYRQRFNKPDKNGMYLYDYSDSEKMEYFVSHKLTIHLYLTEIEKYKWISGFFYRWNSMSKKEERVDMNVKREVFPTRESCLISLVKEVRPKLLNSSDKKNPKQGEECMKAVSWLDIILNVASQPAAKNQEIKLDDHIYDPGGHWSCKISPASGIVTIIKNEAGEKTIYYKCDYCDGQSYSYGKRHKLENILPAAASEPVWENSVYKENGVYKQEEILYNSSMGSITINLLPAMPDDWLWSVKYCFRGGFEGYRAFSTDKFKNKTKDISEAKLAATAYIEDALNLIQKNGSYKKLVNHLPEVRKWLDTVWPGKSYVGSEDPVPENNNLIEKEETQLTEVIQTEENKPAEQVETLSEQLTRCENQVKMGLGMMKQGVSAIGKALEEIVESKLYRLKKETFEIFCPEYFGISSKQAYDYIGAYHDLEHIKAFSPIGDKALPLPTNESQTRSIRNLSPEKKAEIYNTAVQESGGKTPTAAKIKEVADRDKPKKQDPAYYQKIELDKLKGAVQERQKEEITGPEKVTGNDNPWIPELNKTFKLTGPEVLGKFSKVTVPGKDNTREPGEIIEVIPKEKPDDPLRFKVLLYNFPTKKAMVYPEREVKAMEKGATWNEEQLPGQISIMEALEETDSSAGKEIERFKYIKNEIFHLPNRNAPISMIILNHPGHGHFSISVYPEPEKVYSPYTGELLEVEK
jgi:hypothetical protein